MIISPSIHSGNRLDEENEVKKQEQQPSSTGGKAQRVSGRKRGSAAIKAEEPPRKRVKREVIKITEEDSDVIVGLEIHCIFDFKSNNNSNQ